MVRRSRTLGTRCSVAGSSVSSDAARAGRAAFLAPLAHTRPTSGVGPEMWNLYMGTRLPCSPPAVGRRLALGVPPSAVAAVGPSALRACRRAPQHQDPRHAGVVAMHAGD